MHCDGFGRYARCDLSGRIACTCLPGHRTECEGRANLPAVDLGGYDGIELLGYRFEFERGEAYSSCCVGIVWKFDFSVSYLTD